MNYSVAVFVLNLKFLSQRACVYNSIPSMHTVSILSSHFTIYTSLDTYLESSHLVKIILVLKDSCCTSPFGLQHRRFPPLYFQSTATMSCYRQPRLPTRSTISSMYLCGCCHLTVGWEEKEPFATHVSCGTIITVKNSVSSLLLSR